MRNIRCAMLALLWFLVGHSVWAIPPLELFVGQVKVLPVKNVNRIVVGNTSVLSTSVIEDGKALLLPENPGQSNVVLWNEDGRVYEYDVIVAASDQYREKLEVTNLLGDEAGIEVRTVGGRVVLSGETDKENLSKIEALKEIYPTMLSLVQETSDFNKEMIYLDLQIVEFNSNVLRNLGINWIGGAAGPSFGSAKFFHENGGLAFDAPAGVPGVVGTAPLNSYNFFGIATAVSSTLNYMYNNGDAVLIAEPRLSARSGGKADFLAGGQVPVITSNGLAGTNVEYKDFGIKLLFEPETDGDGGIVARVDTEVSSIDLSTSVAGQPPAFRTRRTATDVRLREDETLVISGLVTSETGKSIDKVAGLGDLPVLGHLFRSKQFRESKTELVIFVTPHLVSPDVMGVADTRKAVKNHRQRINQNIKNGLVR